MKAGGDITGGLATVWGSNANNSRISWPSPPPIYKTWNNLENMVVFEKGGLEHCGFGGGAFGLLCTGHRPFP